MRRVGKATRAHQFRHTNEAMVGTALCAFAHPTAPAYFPLKFAARRSSVAFTPSLKSSVARSRVCSASS
ncbi:hypothetical protein ABH992_003315 [Bradyrhizobium yuanmingense]|uniref:Uncharacterized protein n=1 Tax=Bradyrhizobium yuanmingense TaxID=108015 RepID=A0ABV4GHD7_9BRAD